MKKMTIVVEEDGKKKYKRVPVEQTPEEAAADEAAVAYLNDLRECPGEKPPEGLPLACIVKVLDYEEVPKANEAYAMVHVEGADGRIWRLCINRKTVRVGRNFLFVSDRAALPIQPRFQNPAVCNVKEKKYKFGHGIVVRRLLPHVRRHIYHNNSGVLFPMSDFPELKGRRVGTVVAVLLRIDSQDELLMLLQQPRRNLVFHPAPVSAR